MKLASFAILTSLALPSLVVAQTSAASATRYPIVLSHHWSGTANTSFLGDHWDEETQQFSPFAIKQALEAEGATVYQPDKIPFGDHIVRGKLLYKKCEVTSQAGLFSSNEQQQQTLDEALCLRGTKKPIDGVELAMQSYCKDAGKRAGKYRDEADCIQNIKVNIICHSQGCPDSRYMISGMTNQLSGKPMSAHVASWTSLAGANKGTLLADVALGLLACTSGCNDSLLGNLFAYLGFYQTQQTGSTPVYNPLAVDSARALTRKYMTQTMDLSCDPFWRKCAPSFNEAYPNRPNIFYQTYSSKIDRLDPCTEEYGARWLLDYTLEGSNDGLIAVESQRFTTTGYGSNARNVATGVLDRGVLNGEALGGKSYPGMAHMALSNKGAAGMAEAPCAAGSLSDFHFSREDFFKSIAHDLKARGF